MINELSVHPKPTNKNAKIAFYILLAISACVTVVYLIVDTYRGIIGLGALIFITAAVLIYTKYLSCEYYYDVTTDSRGPVFVVRQAIGKRMSTLCRIDIASIVKVQKETAQQRRAHKTPTGYKRYNYLPTLIPKQTYRLTSTSRYEKAEIVVEISDEFATLLMEYANEARELIRLSDDEI